MEVDEEGWRGQCEISPPDKGEWSRAAGEFVRAHTICSAGFIKQRQMNDKGTLASHPLVRALQKIGALPSNAISVCWSIEGPFLREEIMTSIFGRLSIARSLKIW